MMVMPANNTNAHKLGVRYPGRIGMLFSPEGWQNPRDLPFALDNGRFAVWQKGKQWDESAYHKFLDKAAEYKPMWAAVPDVVGDACATFDWWTRWKFAVASRHIPCALVVQDGMTPNAVRKHCVPNMPEVIFVGGTTDWKRRTMWNWCREFPRVHVGRINTAKWLWHAHRCGAESCDGTGFFRGDQMQLKGLLRYLKRTSAGLDHWQAELGFSRYSIGECR